MDVLKKTYMKILERIWIILVLVFAVLDLNVLFVQAQEVTEEITADFTISNGVLTAYQGNDSIITIPEGVTEIRSSVFQNNNVITEVWLPEGLQKIGNYAFRGCSALESVYIPVSLTELGYYGIFEDCPNLQTVVFEEGITAIPNNLFAQAEIREIKLPETITVIGNHAFRGCEQMEKIEIPDGVTEIGSYGFSGCVTLGEILLPKELTRIGNHGFSGCEKLKEIEFPETLTDIGGYAFEQTGLIELKLPENLVTMDNSVFRECQNLESVYIPVSLTELGYYGVFEDCPNLQTVIFEEGITTIPNNLFAESEIRGIELPETITVIGNHAFRGCEQMEKIEIPDGVTEIGSYGFSGCVTLGEVLLPKELTRIGNHGFSGCEKLKEIEFPETLTDIGGYAFEQTGLIELKLPENLVTMDNSVFRECQNLESVYIPVSLTELGYYGVFGDCPNLQTVVFEEGITTIPNNLFAQSGIRGIKLPETITVIGNHAFRDCEQLEKIEIPDKVTEIGSYGFSGCVTLREVLLPKELTRIGNHGFSGCEQLKEIEFPETLTEIGAYAFERTGLLEAVLPENLAILDNGAFEECDYLQSVYVPSALTDVSYYGPFAECPNLKRVTFEEGITAIPEYLFAETSIESIVIPDTVTSIRNYAFRENDALVSINIGKNVTEISENAFSDCPNVVIYCYSGSTAANYAVKYNIAYELLDAHEHEFSEWKIIRKATCTQEGRKQQSCLCGAVAYAEIPELGHAYYEYRTVDYEPTCTRDGQSSRHCSRCSSRIDVQTQKSQGHVYGEWITMSEPDYEHVGSQKKVCSVCADAVTEEIPKLAVNWEELSGYGLVKVNVIDGMSGKPLEDAEVAFALSEKEIFTATTNAEGYVQKLIPVGDYKIQVYKSGYTARTVKQVVFEGEQTLNDIAISSQSVIGGDLTVTEMTLEEIKAAGIDTSDPSNNHVYKYEIKLRFEEGYEMIELPITTLKNANGGILGFWFGMGGGSGGGVGGGSNEFSFTLGGSKYRICVVNECFYIVLHGETKWLKEMFAVDLIVANNSAVDDFNDCTATLDIPYGVSLAAMRGAAQSESIEIGTIERGTSQTVSWYIRGDLEGDYHLSAFLTGTMSSYGDLFSYEYKTKTPFHVYAGSAMHLNVILSDAAYFNEPYTIILELENVSDKILYNVEHKVNDIAQYSVKEYTWIENGEVVDYKEEWAQLDKTQFGDKAMVTKEKFMPGEKLVVMVQTTVLWESPLQKTKQNSKRLSNLLSISGLSNIPEGKVMDVILDLISYMDVRYYLTDTMVSALEGSTATIPTDFIIEHKPGIRLEDKLMEIFGDKLKDQTIKYLTGGVEEYENAITIYEGLQEDLKIYSASSNTKVQVWVENADGEKPILSVDAGSAKLNEEGKFEFTGSDKISVNALNSGEAYLMVEDEEGNIYRKLYTVKKAGPGVAQFFGNYAKLLENKDILIEPDKEITEAYVEYLEKLNFVILDQELRELGEGQKIPTGAIIKDKDTGEQKMFVVNGDTDSDAEIDIFDGDRIWQMLQGLAEMTDAQKTAAETTGNEELTPEDVVEIFRYLLEDEDAETAAYSLRRDVGEQLTISAQDLDLSGYEIQGLQVDIQNDDENVMITEVSSVVAEGLFNDAGHIGDGLWRTLCYSDQGAFEEEAFFTISYVLSENVKTARLPVHVRAVTDQGNVELDEVIVLTAAEEPAEKEVVRISGASRYDTAFQTADILKQVLDIDKFDSVVIATGQNFADALAGSYLAAVKQAPILLTNGKDDNIEALHNYIAENVSAGGNVYILGGEAAVPGAAEKIEGYEVIRLSGKSRYDTNLAILAEAGINTDSVIVATGKTFADSLSASASKLPILLVKPNAALNEAQESILKGMKDIYIVGGEGAVSAACEAELKVFGEVTRVSGKSRYDTSAAAARIFFGETDTVVVASGKNFPDGLCGGPLAAAMDSPLILTADGKTKAAGDYCLDHEIKSGFVLGGTGALSDNTIAEIFGSKGTDIVIKK